MHKWIVLCNKVTQRSALLISGIWFEKCGMPEEFFFGSILTLDLLPSKFKFSFIVRSSSGDLIMPYLWLRLTLRLSRICAFWITWILFLPLFLKLFFLALAIRVSFSIFDFFRGLVKNNYLTPWVSICLYWAYLVSLLTNLRFSKALLRVLVSDTGRFSGDY